MNKRYLYLIINKKNILDVYGILDQNYLFLISIEFETKFF